MAERPADGLARINKKPIPIVATILLVLAVIMGGFMLSLSEETPTSMGDGIGFGAGIMVFAFMISGFALLCAILSIVSICIRQWRAWSCVMLVLCLALFVYVVWQINS